MAELIRDSRIQARLIALSSSEQSVCARQQERFPGARLALVPILAEFERKSAVLRPLWFETTYEKPGPTAMGNINRYRLANRDLNQVTWEERVLAGDPRCNVSQTVPVFEFARYAQMLGLTAIRVDKPEEVGAAWDKALEADRPVVLEAIADPEVPTLPPHITFEQAKKFTGSMIKGEPHLGHTLKETFREAIENFLPHKK